ncbi:helix-turn-helix domain-containing protein [Sphingobium sp. AP49]|uniref:TetR/AcrR family transcriptional regulator n=1 Tax=Sphingobium sp. AP49 TaxID=1144307 RepID=UPI00026ED0D8|nr:helix-turn-helix domain-containing protein [Sphingobium sp. AP49]WHO40934.1 helix-turn-helix domain-containing protein [Sphingobium sp. AP49]
MTNLKRQRDDPRREATRDALIDAAERLISEEGLEKTSTRQIATAIGALNTNVVAYHFGSKDGLIQAVLHRRLPGIDARRGALLAALDVRDETPTILDLMTVFALPLFEQTGANGQHSFVRFLGALERSGKIAARGFVVGDYPQSERVTQLLVACLPPETRHEGHRRLRLVLSMLTTAIQMLDHDGVSPGNTRHMFENAIVMAAAAFGAPAAKELHS